MGKNESSGMILIFDPQCHTLVTFFLNLPIFILVKKYLKYTLHALNIPMTSKHDTMTIFTTLCM